MSEKKVYKKKEPAIKAIRDYLVELLEEESWCKANQIGDMLKTLLELSPPTPHGISKQYAEQQAQGMAHGVGNFTWR
jgi:hypothetical protein